MMQSPLLLYVHIPFCLSKCHFCDWVTEIPVADLRRGAEDPKRKAYLEALKTQIREHGASLRREGRKPYIMYWGGGTATILNEREIDEIAAAIHEAFDLDNLQEATIEGSPGTITRHKLEHFRKVGFSRTSLGVQSFHDGRLRALGRTHNATDAKRAVEDARAAGFEDVSLDLICGLPDEDPHEALESVRVATSLPANHIALYPYRPAAGTTLVRRLRVGRAGRLRADDQQTSYRLCAEELQRQGFEEYAASHFGAPPCHSDLAYFQLKMDWLGCGSGATSLLDGEFLSTRRGYLNQYLNAPTTFDERVPASSAAVAARLVYQALTTREGIVRALFEERMKEPLDDVLHKPDVKALLDTVRRITPLHEDADGLRIPGTRIASTFIRLLFMTAPERAREVNRPQEILGYH